MTNCIFMGLKGKVLVEKYISIFYFSTVSNSTSIYLKLLWLQFDWLPQCANGDKQYLTLFNL